MNSYRRVLCTLACIWFNTDGAPAQTCSPINNFKNVNQDTKIFGSTFLTLSGHGLVGCAKQCLLRFACQSFNYELITTTCQLNKNSSTATMQPGGNVSTAVGTVSSDKSTWPTRVAGACGNSTCPDNSVCVEQSDGSTSCIVECPDPVLSNGRIMPDIHGQTLSAHSKKVGIHLKFNCSHGFWKIGHATCLNNGTWSDFGCEKGCVNSPSLKNATLLDDRKDWPVGTVLNYTCDTPLVRLGRVECTTEFTWTHMRCIQPVKNCAELIKCNSSYTDDEEYWLVPEVFGDKPVKIYCHNLASGSPKPFLTLPGDTFVDYSDQCCNNELVCTNDFTDKNCYSTRFLKVALADIQSMTITVSQGRDTTFTNTSNHCSLIYFGSIVNCCLRGRDFVVDTRNTGLIIDPEQKWIHINKSCKSAVMTTNKTDSGRIIRVSCSQTGLCFPKDRTYRFVVDDLYSPVISEAIQPMCGK